MSELTTCNYCKLQRYKHSAREAGNHIEVVNVGGFLPFEVYELPKGRRYKDLTPKQREAARISSMMAISDSCAC
jgi:hypothetical protein